MTLSFFIYRSIIIPLILILKTFLSPFLDKKTKKTIQLKDQNEFVVKQAFTNKPIWIHCASGEFEYAKPVIRECKKKYPEIPILITYFSSSLLPILEKNQEIDIYGPLPWDTPSAMKSFIGKWQPQCLLIARSDVWPEMTYQSRKMGIPILLFSATLSEQSSRLTPWLKPLVRFAYNQVSLISCVNEEDFNNFKSLDLSSEIQVWGDTRYDQVFYRLNHAQPLKHKTYRQNTLIAGSTWPEDERVILKFFSLLKQKKSDVKMILVPHEPDTKHINDLIKDLKSYGLSHHLYSDPSGWSDEDVLLVNQVGLLAELYQLGDFAFVGGSFKKQVHSVMEPLASGLITFVGPYFKNNREAVEFQSLSLSSQNTSPVISIFDENDWLNKFTKIKFSQDTKFEIKKLVQNKQGTVSKVMIWLENLLQSR